jgi:hypothetical protein
LFHSDYVILTMLVPSTKADMLEVDLALAWKVVLNTCYDEDTEDGHYGAREWLEITVNISNLLKGTSVAFAYLAWNLMNLYCAILRVLPQRPSLVC